MVEREKMKRIQTRAYNVKYRRYREGRTDYRQRIKLLSSGKTRIFVKRGLNNIVVQFIKFDVKGDKTLLGVHSRELSKFGWKGHRGNMPSAYLTGYLCGLKAIKKDLREGVLDLGTSRVNPKTSLFAAVKGLKDAGINLACSDEVIPNNDFVTGKSIADYATKLSGNKDIYSKQFSKYAKEGVDTLKLYEHFDAIKKKIGEEWQ